MFFSFFIIAVTKKLTINHYINLVTNGILTTGYSDVALLWDGAFLCKLAMMVCDRFAYDNQQQ